MLPPLVYFVLLFFFGHDQVKPDKSVVYSDLKIQVFTQELYSDTGCLFGRSNQKHCFTQNVRTNILK